MTTLDIPNAEPAISSTDTTVAADAPTSTGHTEPSVNDTGADQPNNAPTSGSQKGVWVFVADEEGAPEPAFTYPANPDQYPTDYTATGTCREGPKIKIIFDRKDGTSGHREWDFGPSPFMYRVGSQRGSSAKSRADIGHNSSSRNGEMDRALKRLEEQGQRAQEQLERQHERMQQGQERMQRGQERVQREQERVQREQERRQREEHQTMDDYGRYMRNYERQMQEMHVRMQEQHARMVEQAARLQEQAVRMQEQAFRHGGSSFAPIPPMPPMPSMPPMPPMPPMAPI
ncbi:hypothetical protein BC830DRAFT_1085950 [Chytriomyces sp. MP71]|nr:hypothetical protein BC830DRAFT_1085950 [Chytriomyces sp. MP71]